MEVIPHYKCDHCKTIYADETRAAHCEAAHIGIHDLDMLRALHTKCPPVNTEIGQFPDQILISKKNTKGIVIYKFAGDYDIDFENLFSTAATFTNVGEDEC